MKRTPLNYLTVAREEKLVLWARNDNKQKIRELESMRSLVKQEDSHLLEELITLRKREAKGDYEALEKAAEFFDKSAIPLAAAFPTLAMFLATEHVLDGPFRFPVLLASYMLGGTIWGFFRWMSLRLAQEARRGLADLGKVD